jgi:cyclase
MGGPIGPPVNAARGHFTLEELAPGVHAAIATPDGFGLCNAGIVDLGGASLVFDAMLTPQAGEALGRAAQRLTGRPTDFLVNSHYHGDHVRGNSAVAPVRIVSSKRVRELVIERASAHLASDRAEVPGELEGLRSGRIAATPVERPILEAWYEGVLATPPDLAVRPPDLTLERELVLHGSRRSARVLSYGGGHSPSDVLVFLPAERIAFLGDLFFSGFHPSMGDGDPDALLRILAEVRELGPDRALPGHGPVGGVPEIRALEQYIVALQHRARERRSEGKAPANTEGEVPPPPYDRWKFSAFYRKNLEFVQDRLAEPAAPPA